MKIRKSMDELPWIVKLILIIVLGPIYGALYRLANFSVKNLIIAAVWFFTGGLFVIGWILDVLSFFFKGKPTLLVE